MRNLNLVGSLAGAEPSWMSAVLHTRWQSQLFVRTLSITMLQDGDASVLLATKDDPNTAVEVTAFVSHSFSEIVTP